MYGGNMRFILVFTLYFLTTAAISQDQRASSVVNLYGVTFKYGIPPWVTPGNDMLKQMKPFRDQKGPSFLLEFIPADQEFENWTEMFSVSAFRNNQPAPVEMWRQVSLATLAKVCSGYDEQTLLTGEKVVLVKVICPRVTAVAPIEGFSGGVGQVAVFAFMVSGNVLINHRMEWRGSAFDAGNKSSWPATGEEIDEALSILKQATAMNGQTLVQFPAN